MVEVVVHLVGLTVVDHFGKQPSAVGVYAVVKVSVTVVPGNGKVYTFISIFADALLVHTHTNHL